MIFSPPLRDARSKQVLQNQLAVEVAFTETTKKTLKRKTPHDDDLDGDQ